MTTDTTINDLILNVWEEVELLRHAIADLQPSEKREVGLNLVRFIQQDTKYIAHKYGVALT